MTVWFTSDLHIGHLRIIELTDRPFNSVEEMNEILIENYNALVRPEDTCYHLGDCCMGQLITTLPLLKQLNGHKILAALGNHDRPSKLFHHKTEQRRGEWTIKYLDYFEEIYESMELQVPGFEKPWLLHHLPYRDDSFIDHAYEGRYREFQPIDEGQILLHGHIHSTWKYKEPRQVNVGVDVWDYRPVSLDQIVGLLSLK